MDDAARARAAYDAMARAYTAAEDDSPWNALYERPATIALLPAVEGRRVLDAGCGSGPLSAWLHAAGAQVTGLDVSPAMIELARARGLPGARFAVADLAEPLALPDGAFDVVVASLVLHYLEDWVPTLRELHRVLAPGGVLVLSTHHPAQDVALSASGDYFATELLHDRWTKGGEAFDVHFWRRPLHAMSAAFAEAGFVLERLEEPMPLPECEARFPDAWEALTTRPAFLFARLRPRVDSGQGAISARVPAS
jgi:SAM-dependent methyltransferase